MQCSKRTVQTCANSRSHCCHYLHAGTHKWSLHCPRAPMTKLLAGRNSRRSFRIYSTAQHSTGSPPACQGHSMRQVQQTLTDPQCCQHTSGRCPKTPLCQLSSSMNWQPERIIKGAESDQWDTLCIMLTLCCMLAS